MGTIEFCAGILFNRNSPSPFIIPTTTIGNDGMSSTVGGDDETHDLSTEEKDKLEKNLRAEARALMRTGAKKLRNAL